MLVLLAAIVVGASVVGVDKMVVQPAHADAPPRPAVSSATSSSALSTTSVPPPVTTSPAPEQTPDQILAAAMAPLAANKTGDFSVGVLDQDNGVTASYNGAQTYDTASIVKADILAVLLLRAQQRGTPLTDDEDEAATRMIENSDNDSATTLWDDVGGASGMSTTNVTFGLKDTVPGTDGYWGLTTTTVTDQLAVLTALTSDESPLDATSRAYALDLMHQIETDQAWGVSAAADPGTTPALKNGWLPVDDDNDLWVINSIGQVTCGGHNYLVAVLSNSQPDEQTGINQVSAVAKAAVTALADSYVANLGR